MTRRTHVLSVVGVASGVLVLAAGSTVAVAAAGGAFNQTDARAGSMATCAIPALPGTVADISLVDMGNTMSANQQMMGGTGSPMRLLATPASVAAGTVSFRVHNDGSRVHELIVLPLDANQPAGQRVAGPDARVDEAGSLGEASRTCGADAGEGIAAGAAGWTTLTLHPGTYELLCNLAHHYNSGMYATLTVR